MSGVNFARAKLTQGYLQPLQRTSCSNCRLRVAGSAQCGRGGFFVMALGICKDHQSVTPQADTKEPA